jgi:hypothetical protein
MGLNDFMYLPIDELDLLNNISHEISTNYDFYHGQNIYFHLIDAGDKKSIVDDIKYFTDLYDFGDYLHIEKRNHACVIMRSDPDSIALFMVGEHTTAGTLVTKNNYIFDYLPHTSCLPARRRSKLTIEQVMMAFGYIEDSLKKTRGHKAN